MKIAIGADHRGFLHKEYIKQTISEHEWIDVGCFNQERTDYPLYAESVVQSMCNGDADCGVLLCGSGVGMAIAANRHQRIYAALVWNEEVARQSKAEDNANILVFPSDFISKEDAVAMIRAWLTTAFKGGRYQERLNMIDRI